MAIHTLDWNEPSLWKTNGSFSESAAAGATYNQVIGSSGARIVMIEMAAFPADSFRVYLNSGFQIAMVAFDADGLYLGRTNGYLSAWQAVSGSLTINRPANGAYFVVVLRRGSGSPALLPADVAQAGFRIEWDYSTLAVGTITVSSVVDVAAVYRYYLLQSSTLAAPSPPTNNPPDGSWSLAEPSYSSGSTNSLYFTDLTVFSDGTYTYSAVNVSSSYEAAKAAWNKAQTAQDNASAAQSTANAVRTDFQRVVRIDTNGLHIGDNQTTHELLLTSDSLDVIVDGITYSRFAAHYAQFGAYQIREAHDGGLVFKLGDPLDEEIIDGPHPEQ